MPFAFRVHRVHPFKILIAKYCGSGVDSFLSVDARYCSTLEIPISRMLELDVFADLPLRGGLRLKEVRRASAPLVDAIGRPAVARTLIIGKVLEVELQPDLSDEETSVSLYHEVLEGATLAVLRPPAATIDLNESGSKPRPGKRIPRSAWRRRLP